MKQEQIDVKHLGRCPGEEHTCGSIQGAVGTLASVIQHANQLENVSVDRPIPSHSAVAGDGKALIGPGGWRAGSFKRSLPETRTAAC